MARALDVDVLMISLPHLKNSVLQIFLGNACKAAVLPMLLMSMSNDLAAAHEESGFAALAGECLRTSGVARALDVDVLMTSLPHLKNLFLRLLLGSTCVAAVLRGLLIPMS